MISSKVYHDIQYACSLVHLWHNCGIAVARHKHDFGTGSTRFRTIYTHLRQSLSVQWQINTGNSTHDVSYF